MSCRQYRDSVVLLSDGELTEDAAREVRSHVDACEHCAAVLAELEHLRTLLTPATAEKPSLAETRFWRSFEADLALRINRVATPLWRRAIVLPVPAAVAMSVVVVSLGVMVVHERKVNARLTSKNAHLQAAIESVENEVVFAVSPRMAESLRRIKSMDLAEERRFLEFPFAGAAEPRAFTATEPERSATPELARAFQTPRPATKTAAPVSPQLMPGTEIRFVDSELHGIDMY